jgi:hypothetical protein
MSPEFTPDAVETNYNMNKSIIEAVFNIEELYSD